MPNHTFDFMQPRHRQMFGTSNQQQSPLWR